MVGRGWTWDREARIWIFAMSFPSRDLGHIPKPLWTLISLSSSNTNMSAGVSREAQSESVQSISLLPASRVLSISFYFLYTNWQRHLAPQGSPWLCSVYQILELPGLWKQSIRWNELAKMASVPDAVLRARLRSLDPVLTRVSPCLWFTNLSPPFYRQENRGFWRSLAPGHIANCQHSVAMFLSRTGNFMVWFVAWLPLSSGCSGASDIVFWKWKTCSVSLSFLLLTGSHIHV